MILHLGVIDLPYAQAPKSRRRKGKIAAGTQTTGDVAGWIEDKYALVETFAGMHMGDVIEPALRNSVEGAFEDLLAGAPLGNSIFGTAEGEIEDSFRKALDDKEFDGVIPGVATQAALRGVNHRLKHPYRRRKPRPSFVDTGLFQANFKAWVD